MSIAIDKALCIGCGRCADICPGNLIRMKKTQEAEARTAYLKFPNACWSCTSCMKECPVGAISLTLPLAAGGRGGKLTARRQKNITTWTVRKPDGRDVKIETDTAEANRY